MQMNKDCNVNQLFKENECNNPKTIEYYISQINMLIEGGWYWKAMELVEKVNQFVNKSEWADKPQILYSSDWEDFISGMCCCASADSCLSGVGGCSGCGSGLCAAFCLCYCCTGENPAQGCDCLLNCWNNCFCVEILCGKGCKC